MSFLFSLSPFRALASSPSTSAPTEGEGFTSHRTPPDPRNGRRALTRQQQHESLQSPFCTPSKPAPRSVYASNGKISSHEQLMLGQTAATTTTVPRVDSDAESDEGCFLVDDTQASQGITADFIADLPHELAVLIMLHLSTHHSLLACGLVSRSWRVVAQDPLVWRDFFHRNAGWALKPDKYAEALLQRLPDYWLTNAPTDVYNLQHLRNDLAGEATQIPSRIASPAKWWVRTPSSITQSLPRRTSKPRYLDQLNWSLVYADRYRLSRKWGEVVGYRHRPACDPRDGHYADARRLQRNKRHYAFNEDWEDDDTDSEVVQHEHSGSDGENDDDEETIARRRVARESRLIRRTLNPASTTARLATHDGSSTMQLPKRWLPRVESPEVRVLGAHADAVYCVRTCPLYDDGSPSSSGYIVTGSRDRQIRVWDTRTEQCLHVLSGHDRSILAMDICSAGEILVSGSSDQTLGFWSWFGCQEAREAARRGETFVPQLLEKWNCRVTVMDVRLSDEYMVLGLRNGQIRSYKRMGKRDFRRVSVYNDRECSVNDLRIRGDYVAAAYAGGSLDVVHIPTGKLHRALNHRKGVACVGFDGDIVATGSSDYLIRCWRLSTGQLLLVLRGHTELPRSIRLDAQRGLLLSAGYDGRINVWDVSLLLPHDVVDRSALGADWRVQAIFHRRERIEAERAQAQKAAPQKRSDDDEDDGGTAPEPHPLCDPVNAYRPRLFFWERGGDVRRRHHEQQQHQGAAVTVADGEAAPAPAPPTRSNRLFDATFDGKRIIAVGEAHTFSVREFLPEDERFQLKWDIFA